MQYRSLSALPFFIFGSIVTILSACSGPSDRVLITLLDADASPHEHSAQIEASGGTLVGPILHNTGPLPNEALPAGTTDLSGSLISISHFLDVREEQTYMAELENQPDVALVATARRVGWLPFIGPTKPLETLGTVEPPAFVLVNLIEQGPLINPVNASRMFAYMRTATPRLQDENVEFVSPLLIDKVIVGDPASDLLFLTIWPDRQTFDDVHNDPRFVALANQTRNRVFQGFTENAAIP